MDFSSFEKEVLSEAYRITASKVWNDEVIDLFWRWDFDPSRWQDLYLEFVRDL